VPCDSGQFLNDVGRYVDAADSYLTASRLSPDDFELVFNTASALRSVIDSLPWSAIDAVSLVSDAISFV